MAAHQASPSLGFSRQEHWSGLPFPPPMHASESQSEVPQSCPTLSDAMDCSLPGSSVHGIFQARVLEWGAIAFSDSVFLPCHIYPFRTVRQWSPTFLAPGTDFVEDNFSMDQGEVGVSMALHFMCNSTSSHQNLDPRGW